MLDITCYDDATTSNLVLNLASIREVESASEPDAFGSLVTVRDIAGNLFWGFKGSSSDGDAWLTVSRKIEAPSRDFNFFKAACARIWVNDFGSFTSAAHMGCPID